MLCFELCFPPSVHGQRTAQTSAQTSNQSSQASVPEQSISRRNLLRVSSNGVWWASLSADNKADFVDGYVTAMAVVSEALMRIIEGDSKKLTAGDPQFDARTSALLNMAVLAAHYDYGHDRASLVAGVDNFYRDPQNTHITIEFALMHVRDSLNGKTAPKDLEKQLNEWRAIVNK